MLLLTISYFPPLSPQVASLAMTPAFISSIGSYISHLDQSVRRCGMLAAEFVAQLAGKTLDFGDWDGDQYGKPWARQLRQLISDRDIDADSEIVKVEDDPQTKATDQDISIAEELSTTGANQYSSGQKITKPKPTIVKNAVDYDSDDSLTGYASPSSSRSNSPTPSELEDFEKDPTLRVGVKKIPRPVYLAQLGELVRNTSGAKPSELDQEADKLEMALECGEELVRRKKGYGVELGMSPLFHRMQVLMPPNSEENAVNLVYGFVSLQDNFDLEGFDLKRQAILNALVACCPRIAAP